MRFLPGELMLPMAYQDESGNKWNVTEYPSEYPEGGVLHGTVIGWHKNDAIVKLENQADEGTFVVVRTTILRSDDNLDDNDGDASIEMSHVSGNDVVKHFHVDGVNYQGAKTSASHAQLNSHTDRSSGDMQTDGDMKSQSVQSSSPLPTHVDMLVAQAEELYTECQECRQRIIEERANLHDKMLSEGSAAVSDPTSKSKASSSKFLQELQALYDTKLTEFETTVKILKAISSGTVKSLQDGSRFELRSGKYAIFLDTNPDENHLNVNQGDGVTEESIVSCEIDSIPDYVLEELKKMPDMFIIPAILQAYNQLTSSMKDTSGVLSEENLRQILEIHSHVLLVAVRKSDRQAVECLLRSFKQHPSVCDTTSLKYQLQFPNTLFKYAASRGGPQIIDYLIKFFGNKHLCTDDLLFEAVRESFWVDGKHYSNAELYWDTEVIPYLVKLYEDMDCDECIFPSKSSPPLSSDWNSLHAAGLAKRHEALRFLIPKFVARGGSESLDITDESGNTCLHYSVKHEETVRLLVQYGADVDIRNDDGDSALEKLVQRIIEIAILLDGLEHTSQDLRKNGALAESYFVAKSSHSYSDVYANQDMSFKDFRENTNRQIQSHTSKLIRYEKIASYLLSVGADPTVRDVDMRIERARLAGDPTDRNQAERILFRYFKFGANYNYYVSIADRADVTNSSSEVTAKTSVKRELGVEFQDSNMSVSGVSESDTILSQKTNVRSEVDKYCRTNGESAHPLRGKYGPTIMFHTIEFGSRFEQTQECHRGEALELVKQLVHHFESANKLDDMYAVSKSSGATIFQAAAEFGSLSLLMYLVNHAKANDRSHLIFQVDNSGAGIVHSAVRNELYIVKYVIELLDTPERRELIWKTDGYGNTPLTIAAGFEKVDNEKRRRFQNEIVQYLRTTLRDLRDVDKFDEVKDRELTKGVKEPPNEVNDGQFAFAPIVLAAARGNFQGVSDLEELGADIDSKDGEGHTALSRAVLNEHFDIADFLLRCGADPTVYLPDGTQTAYKLIHSEEQKNIFKRDDESEFQYAHRKKLLSYGIRSVQTMYPSVLELLWKADPTTHRSLLLVEETEFDDVSVMATSIDSDLHLAAKRGRLDDVARVVASGVDLDKVNETGRTALQTAVRKGHLKVADYLLRHGASPILNRAEGRGELYEVSSKSLPFKQDDETMFNYQLRTKDEALFFSKAATMYPGVLRTLTESDPHAKRPLVITYVAEKSITTVPENNGPADKDIASSDGTCQTPERY